MSFAGEIDYIEDFVLAKQRERALKQLIPGTEDYYYYHCMGGGNPSSQPPHFCGNDHLRKCTCHNFGRMHKLLCRQLPLGFYIYQRPY